MRSRRRAPRSRRRSEPDARAGARPRRRALRLCGLRSDRHARHAAAAVERPDTKKGLARVAALAEESGAERIVVGPSADPGGGGGRAGDEARAFAERLARRVSVPVELHDERMTTRLAERIGGEGDADSRAAAHLLESYLARAASGNARVSSGPPPVPGGRSPEEREAARREREARRAAHRGGGRSPRRAPSGDWRPTRSGWRATAGGDGAAPRAAAARAAAARLAARAGAARRARHRAGVLAVAAWFARLAVSALQGRERGPRRCA